MLIEPLRRASVGKRSSRKVCRALPDCAASSLSTSCPLKAMPPIAAWQQLNVLAHNLCRSFQLDTIAETKGISRKRTCTHLLHTIRFRIINKAGRLVRVSGRNALRMATNSSTQTLFERIELALAS